MKRMGNVKALKGERERKNFVRNSNGGKKQLLCTLFESDNGGGRKKTLTKIITVAVTSCIGSSSNLMICSKFELQIIRNG